VELQRNQQPPKNEYDWSDMPPIPAYRGDERPLPLEQRLWLGFWPGIFMAAILLLNFQIHPLPWWWKLVWTVLFGVLLLRAFQISSSWKQRAWPIGFVLVSLLGWWVLPAFLSGRPGHIWEILFWPLAWPFLLEGLMLWLNFRSGLLPWWWHWTQLLLLMIVFFLAGFLVSRFLDGF
jgi:hypothetical protein